MYRFLLAVTLLVGSAVERPLFAETPPLPVGVTVTVTKQGEKPASIFVVTPKEKVRFAEGEWEKVPQEARVYVDHLFNLKNLASIRVTVDCSDAPESEKWAQNAARVAEEQFPVLVELLDGEGFVPAKEVKLVFKKMKGVAHASGTTITISAEWIEKNPDDIGMVVHELVHVVQAYKHRVPGWITEGIADYIRFFLYEKNGDRTCRVNPDRSKYTDSYRTTGAFFDWIVRHRNPKFVHELNKICRTTGLPEDQVEEVFEKLARDKPEKLWEEFTESIRNRNK